MFNKIYNKIKKYIRENFVEICVYLVFLFSVLCPVNYYIITGGGIFDASKRVSLDTNYSSKGSFNMAYVSEIKGTIFTYLLSYIIPSFERDSMDDYKTNDQESAADIEFRNSLWLNQTNNNAIYVAYHKAGKKLEEKSYSNYVFYIDEQADTNLKVGDQILKVDDHDIRNLEELKSYVHTKKVGEEIQFTVMEKKKEFTKYAKVYEEDAELYIGISLLEDVIYNPDPKVTFKFKESESGPSGGLIMSLQIYNMLIKKDITKGKKIVGTGTISKDESVGEIDGVKHKLRGAVKNKADVFLVPAGRNYQEAIKEKKKNNYQIQIIEVGSFDEAIQKLENL